MRRGMCFSDTFPFIFSNSWICIWFSLINELTYLEFINILFLMSKCIVYVA